MTNPYDCALCGRDTQPEHEPSPCESHEVCPRCAPCFPCLVDTDEDNAIRDRRESDA